MFGLNSEGFKRKQYSDIVESLQARAIEYFGDTINLTDRSFLGMLINVIAYAISILWSLAEKVYFSRFVDYSEGSSLDVAVRNAGVERRASEFATGTFNFEGTGTVPSGTIVASGTIQFQTTESGDVETDIPIIALVAGTGSNLSAGLIDTVVTELPNVTGGAGSAATGGRNIETDPELRARYFNSFASAGAATKNALISALLRTTGVRAADVNEEIDGSSNVIGIRTIVLGGSNDDVAQTVSDYKAHGIKTFGAETGTATTINGETYIVNFDFATVVDIYANITLTAGAAFPLDGSDQVKNVIIAYIGGTDEATNIYTGLSLGEDVIYSKIISKCFEIPGVEEVELELSDDNITFVTANVAIGQTEVSETDFNKVVITVV